MDNSNYIDSTKYWLQKTVIGYNFCPFAKREFDKKSINYRILEDSDPKEQLFNLVEEFRALDADKERETSLLIIPYGLESFFDYLDFLEIANELLISENYEGVYQLASFHPDYCFDGCEQNDPSNYTNRSPYPVIHILREASLEKAIQSHPDAEAIPQTNIDKCHKLGAEIFADILKQSEKDEK